MVYDFPCTVSVPLQVDCMELNSKNSTLNQTGNWNALQRAVLTIFPRDINSPEMERLPIPLSFAEKLSHPVP